MYTAGADKKIPIYSMVYSFNEAKGLKRRRVNGQ